MTESNLVLTISDRKQFMRRFSSAERDRTSSSRSGFFWIGNEQVPPRKPGGRKNSHYQRHLTPTIPRS